MRILTYGVERHVDSAQMYGNEVEVGDAVRASGLNRSEVFISKLRSLVKQKTSRNIDTGELFSYEN